MPLASLLPPPSWCRPRLSRIRQGKPPPNLRDHLHPLGVSSSVRALGTNNVAMLEKNLHRKSHGSSQKFTNTFNPDFFVL